MRLLPPLQFLWRGGRGGEVGWLALALLVCVVVADSDGLHAASSPEKTSSSSSGPAAETLQGFLVAASATEIYAPEFIFRVAGWQSDWGSRKLLELAADGKEVKKGDTLARFEFGADDALRHVKERIQRAQNDFTQNQIGAGQALEALEMEQRRKQIDARMATLNLERERSLSRRQADGLRILHQLAEFDVVAAGDRLASARVKRAAETHHRQSVLDKANEGMERYQYYVQRFQLKAPHDGVVRHAFNPRERRKLAKGDNAQAGMKILSLAKDATLAVRFFLPEGQAARVGVGSKVAVMVPTTAEEVAGVVDSVDFFPQELGFLQELEGPNEREKAIQVKASLVSPPAGLAAGTEVRVKIVELVPSSSSSPPAAP
ncbi:MAG: HlyD family efflux transporter periplasmic adaptor subunit [Deltaproteobacteria bacterium]|nr:HlyD family efflux transporter periplasmic adaptor subunit [Deltaproteobacteria bacterium]